MSKTTHEDIMKSLRSPPEIKNKVSGTRQDRSYLTQKRGNFQGKQQEKTREKLKELAKNVRES